MIDRLPTAGPSGDAQRALPLATTSIRLVVTIAPDVLQQRESTHKPRSPSMVAILLLSFVHDDDGTIIFPSPSRGTQTFVAIEVWRVPIAGISCSTDLTEVDLMSKCFTLPMIPHDSRLAGERECSKAVHEKTWVRTLTHPPVEPLSSRFMTFTVRKTGGMFDMGTLN